MAEHLVYRVMEDDLSGDAIAALLRLHLNEMHAWSPPESVHAMDIARLRGADVTFFSAWDGAVLAACGAIKQLSPDHGEIKSMRADPAYRGRGAGKAILDHLIALARSRGYARLSLETGAPSEFAPAHRLYLVNGFVDCGPFGTYRSDPFSRFMTRTL